MLQLKKLTEREIIDRIIAGEKVLYELIVRRFNPELYKSGSSYNYNHQGTQHLMQVGYIEAFNKLTQLEARAALRTWIISTTWVT